MRRKNREQKTVCGLFFFFSLRKKKDKISAPFSYSIWERNQEFVAKTEKRLFGPFKKKNILIDGKKCRAVL